MPTTIYIPRISGGTLILSVNPTPPSPIATKAIRVTFRDGKTQATFRDGATQTGGR